MKVKLQNVLKKRLKIPWLSSSIPLMISAISVSLISFNLNAAITPKDMNGQALISVERAQLAPMLDHMLPQLNAKTTKLVSLKAFSGKVVLLDFLASWCGPCRESFPWMNKVMSKYQEDGLEVIAINLDQEAGLADQFLEKVPANFTLLQDRDAVMPEAYGLIGMPSSYLIDKQGRLRAVHIGFHSSKEKEYEAAITVLLKE